MAKQFDVVIVGAGIAGSALAAALSGRGLRLALVEGAPRAVDELPEQRDVDSFDARVSALTPRSVALLDRLGAWPDIAGYRSCAYRHMTVWDAEGTGEIEFDCRDVGAPALGYLVENRAVVRGLWRQLDTATDLTVYNPVRVEACERLEGGDMQLRLDSGDTLHGRLVVAADGAQSRLRQMLEFRTREWDYGHRAIVATVEVERPHEDTAWQRFLPSGPLAFLPLPGDGGRHLCSIVWSLEEGLAEQYMGLDDAEFRACLERAFEARLGRVLAVSRRFAFPLRQRHAVDYVQPGAALVADAAHTIHPLAGQGINLGLADVEVLARELLNAADAGLNPGSIEVLRRYQRQRKGENLLMMAAMDGFKRLFEQRALPVRWLRNAGMRGVGALRPLKQQIMRHAMGIEGGA